MAKSTRKSIIDQPEGCYLCGIWNATERHHVLHGTANRKKAEEDGLTVMLCHACHASVHDKGIGDRLLQQVGQFTWEHVYGDRDAFIARYGKNYLD